MARWAGVRLWVRQRSLTARSPGREKTKTSGFCRLERRSAEDGDRKVKVLFFSPGLGVCSYVEGFGGGAPGSRRSLPAPPTRSPLPWYVVWTHLPAKPRLRRDALGAGRLLSVGVNSRNAGAGACRGSGGAEGGHRRC